MTPLQQAGFLTGLLGMGYTDLKPISDTRWAGLFKFMYTTAIIVGRFGDHNNYDDRWCYHNETDAKAALDAWDGQYPGEPEGWHRHPLTGRRRVNGLETVNW